MQEMLAHLKTALFLRDGFPDDDDGHDGECDYDYHYDGNGGDD